MLCYLGLSLVLKELFQQDEVDGSFFLGLLLGIPLILELLEVASIPSVVLDTHLENATTELIQVALSHGKSFSVLGLKLLPD